jgi:hypothetical protein
MFLAVLSLAVASANANEFSVVYFRNHMGPWSVECKQDPKGEARECSIAVKGPDSYLLEFKAGAAGDVVVTTFPNFKATQVRLQIDRGKARDLSIDEYRPAVLAPGGFISSHLERTQGFALLSSIPKGHKVTLRFSDGEKNVTQEFRVQRDAGEAVSAFLEHLKLGK